MRRLLGFALLIVGCNGDLSGSDGTGGTAGADGNESGGRVGSGGRASSGGRSGSGGKGGGSASGGAAGDAPVDELDCRSAENCPALLAAEVENCAYVDCARMEKGKCTLVAKDVDGDGAPERCRSKHPDIYVFRAPGDRDESKHPWDCGPYDASIHPNAWDGPVGENHDACDGIDNNCNGKIDDDLFGDASCTCTGKATRRCALLDDGSENEYLSAVLREERTIQGTCELGTTTCINGKWGPCQDAVGPQEESCDFLDLDRDCNGIEAMDELDRIDPLTQVEFTCDYDADGQVSSSAIRARACIENNGEDTPVGIGDACGRWFISTTVDRTKLDCDDSDPTRGVGFPEYCDGIDTNCNEIADDLDPNVILPTGGSNVAGYSCDGSRVVLSCTLGYGDCDKAALDGGVASGCETDLRTIEHCGSCTNSCTFSCSGPLSALACAEVESFSLGRGHTCAKVSDGRVACWGNGSSGQLGDGDVLGRETPVTVLDLGQSVASATLVAAGGAHTCAIVAGEVYCWGSGGHRQNASPTAQNRLRPEKLLISEVTSLSAGLEHTCVVLESGSVECWGNQLDGRFGMGQLVQVGGEPVEDGVNGAHPALVNVSGIIDPDSGGIDEDDIGAGGTGGTQAQRPFISATQVAAGAYHTCVLEDERVYCAGYNGNFQLGVGEDDDIFQSLYFVEVPGLDNVSQISTHSDTTCALRLGQVYCWGSNDMGQIGLSYDDADAVGVPRLIPSLTDVTEIAVGGSFVCARVEGTIFCWGENTQGQLGYASDPDEDFPHSTTPVAIPGVSEASALGAGATHACVVVPAGLHCWGGNSFGQLGRGSRSSQAYPTPVLVTPLGPLPGP